MNDDQEHLKLLGRLEHHMDDLIGAGFFGDHVATGCRLCRAHRIRDSLLVLYRLCEEAADGRCDHAAKQCGGPVTIDTSSPPGPQWDLPDEPTQPQGESR